MNNINNVYKFEINQDNLTEKEIDSFKLAANLNQDISLGQFDVRLWSKFIEINPLNTIFDIFKTHQKNAIESNLIMDKSLLNELEFVETNITDFLIINQNNKEIDEIIFKIFKSGEHGISKLNNLILNENDTEKKWSIKTNSLPKEILLIILEQSEVHNKNIICISKFFNLQQKFWKKILFKEYPKLLEDYPDLKIKDHSKIDWRAMSMDLGININRAIFEYKKKNNRIFIDGNVCSLNITEIKENRLPISYDKEITMDISAKYLNVKNVKNYIIKILDLNNLPKDMTVIWVTEEHKPMEDHISIFSQANNFYQPIEKPQGDQRFRFSIKVIIKNPKKNKMPKTLNSDWIIEK